MKRLLPLLLLVGALIGLFGQGIAYAAAPAALPHLGGPAAPSPMSADCGEMMHKQPPRHGQQPCKGLTFDCIVAMGCLPPLFLNAGGFSFDAAGWTPAPSVSLAIHLPPGGDVAPELHPPSTLA